jgi:hypothetical protein
VETVENFLNIFLYKALRYFMPVENLWIKMASFPQAVESQKVFHRHTEFSTGLSTGLSPKKGGFSTG